MDESWIQQWRHIYCYWWRPSLRHSRDVRWPWYDRSCIPGTSPQLVQKEEVLRTRSRHMRPYPMVYKEFEILNRLTCRRTCWLLAIIIIILKAFHFFFFFFKCMTELIHCKLIFAKFVNKLKYFKVMYQQSKRHLEFNVHKNSVNFLRLLKCSSNVKKMLNDTGLNKSNAIFFYILLCHIYTVAHRESGCYETLVTHDNISSEVPEV